jgi:predicted nucleotidyltransferase
MAKKPLRHAESLEVAYNNEHWMLLEKLRAKAARMMEALENAHVGTIIHGSIARGDVTEKSDIDIFAESQPSSFMVESALEKASIPITGRTLVQATPTYAVKAHIQVDEVTTVSFPLMKMRKIEREFYKFGGETNLSRLKEGFRASGVDKRLMLIEPTSEGHKESTVVGREEQAAKLLGISVETVLDRVRTLLRRDEIGRTGVFVNVELSSDETFEMALERFAKKNPAVRRRLASLS